MTVYKHAGGRPLYWVAGLTLATSLVLTSCSSPEPTASADQPVTDSSSQIIEDPERTATDPEVDAPNLSTDTLIVPGDRVGDVTAATTYDDLVERYGEESLESVEVHLGEGFFAPGTRVNQDAQSFSVVWTDDSRTAVQSIRDFGVAWQVESGIGVGTSLSELREKLGEFELYGFGWDYGGTMVLDGTVLEPYKDGLIMRLSPSVPEPGLISQYESVMGERLFPSDTPAFQEMDLVVSEIIVILE